MGNIVNVVTGEPIDRKTFVQAAVKIMLANNLTDLCAALNLFQALIKISDELVEYIAFGIDIAELRTFGGPNVEMPDVLSWDAAEWIVFGEGGAFVIEDRADLS
jgi:hypothetical protein